MATTGQPFQCLTDTGQDDEPESLLSELENKLNELFDTEFTATDCVFLKQVSEAAMESEKLRETVTANGLQHFTTMFISRGALREAERGGRASAQRPA